MATKTMAPVLSKEPQPYHIHCWPYTLHNSTKQLPIPSNNSLEVKQCTSQPPHTCSLSWFTIVPNTCVSFAYTSTTIAAHGHVAAHHPPSTNPPPNPKSISIESLYVPLLLTPPPPTTHIDKLIFSQAWMTYPLKVYMLRIARSNPTLHGNHFLMTINFSKSTRPSK